MENLRVYWRQGCSSCVKVKEYLSGLGVEYESIDVGLRPQAMAELAEMGVRTVPVVARGKDYVFAQALEDVSKFVGVEFRVSRLRPEVLMQKWLHVLSVAQRHAQQIPEDKLGERATPGRDRSIRDLAYHIYQVPESFLECVEHGAEDLPSIYNAAPPANANIAAFGASIEKRLQSWWAKRPEIKGTVKTYYGERPLHELLERCTWHSAQHARQIASVLQGFGIDVQPLLTDADYAGLPMPKGLWE